MTPLLGPLLYDLVLLGGGHAHIHVVAGLGNMPQPGVRVTLVSEQPVLSYSGMLPRWLAGLCDLDSMEVDLARLARATGARFIQARARGVDRKTRHVLLEGRPPLAFDTLSLNIGAEAERELIPGASTHAFPLKPTSSLIDRLGSRLGAMMADTTKPLRIAVVGAGAAGVEVAVALATRSRTARGEGRQGDSVTLIARDRLLPGHNARVQAIVKRALAREGVTYLTGFAAKSIMAGGVLAVDGRSVTADLILLATGSRAPEWLRDTGLDLAPDGSVITTDTLQSASDPAIFAVGDCATIENAKRPKAGVFAVRQGPWLERNLRLSLEGRALRRYRPQKEHLSLLITGGETAVASRGAWLAIEGRNIARLKHRIDTAFVERYAAMGAPQAEPPTAEAYLSGEAMRCGGCAAKIGGDALHDALSRLPPPPPENGTIEIGLSDREDATVVRLQDGSRQIETVDFLRANVTDPYVFGEIAAAHAISDVVAMGGVPERAMALATVPHAAPTLVARDLAQLMAGARATLDAAGAALTGGHSSEAETLGLGFSIVGRALGGSASTARILRKVGARPGDALILTKPLGTGLLLAADMRGAARGRDVAVAIASMRRTNLEAGRILSPLAHALTDITGFGLAGHLLEMLQPEQLGARLNLAEVPLLPGVLALAELGFRSSLTAANIAACNGQVANASVLDLALLCDPQTSGGLLAAVPATAVDQVLEALRSAGEDAAVIGEVTVGTAAPAMLLDGAFLRSSA